MSYANSQRTHNQKTPNLGAIDFSALLQSLNSGGNDGGESAAKNVDSGKLADGLKTFTLDAVQDFAKKEQDNYNNAKPRSEKEEAAKKMGTTIGAVAGGAICAATGVGAAALPLCAAVGGFIGGLISGLFVSPEYSEMQTYLYDKYWKPAGDPKDAWTLKKVIAAERVWNAYGKNNMDSVVSLIRCTRQKGMNNPCEGNKPMFHWVPVDQKESMSIVWNLTDWAHENKGITSFDSDMDQEGAGTFKWRLQCLYEMLEKDQRCLNEVDQSTMRAFAMIKMFHEGIYTPAAVRQYISYYDDGQKESHKQILDPCSPFFDHLDKALYTQRTGKPAVCKDEKDKEKGLSLENPNVVAGTTAVLGGGLLLMKMKGLIG